MLIDLRRVAPECETVGVGRRNVHEPVLREDDALVIVGFGRLRAQVCDRLGVERRGRTELAEHGADQAAMVGLHCEDLGCRQAGRPCSESRLPRPRRP